MDDDLRVRAERTGWRDRDLSARHRHWGRDCPATDIDFLEFDNCEPVALLEFKHERAQPYNRFSASIRACRKLGDAAGVPFFVVIRADDFSWFEINAENQIAVDKFTGAHIRERSRRVTEEKFVRFLYWLRNREAPETVLNNLRLLSLKVAS